MFLASNSINKCTAKDHVVFTDVAGVTTSNTAVFFWELEKERVLTTP